MPIDYKIVPNALTDPPSYSARPVPKVVYDFDGLARQINLHNPTIPEATAKSVLEAFKTETIYQLANGNWINLSGFMSLTTSMPVKLDTPGDPLPTDPLDMKAKPSRPLKTAIRNEASFSRLPYETKTPQILNTFDTNTEINNYVREGFGFRIEGSQLGFDPTDPLQGVFLRWWNEDYVRQTNVSLNNPSALIIVPELDDGAGPNEVEYSLQVRTKYTSGGDIRVGEYSRYLRTTNIITDANNELFWHDEVPGATVSDTVIIDNVDCYFICKKKTDSSIVIQGALLGEEPGPEMVISGAGDYLIEMTGTDDITVTVTSLTNLTANVVAYKNFIQDTCNINITT